MAMWKCWKWNDMKKMTPKSEADVKSPAEELANIITHGMGAVFFLLASPLLLYFASPKLSYTGLIALCVFVIGLISVFLSSTLYHWHWKSPLPLQYRLRVWDHISIYLLIGGTYTILLYQFMPKVYYSAFMTFLWLTILAGSLLKLFFTGRFRILSSAFYLVLGWMAVFFIDSLRQTMPDMVFNLVLYGGITYSVGTVFYIWRSLPFSHSIWHLFVLGGSGMHFAAVWLAVSLPTL